jgi:gentisate 1,2-dioxygenase
MRAELNEMLRHTQTLEDLYKAIEDVAMTPGWIERKDPILWSAPDTAFKPMHWSFSTSRAALEAAGRLIDTRMAERRNLVLRNPIPRNETATLRTLLCAYQSILPGERARSHRHTPHALRVILEAEGAYSIVDGEKHPMETGDVMLTPGWCWHGHGHEGNAAAFWWDGLDVPLVGLLEPMFFEEHAQAYEPVRRSAADSPFRFTWAWTQRMLERAERDPEEVMGRAIRLEAPLMPTLALTIHRLDSGEATRPCREVANSIYVVMQGSGRSSVGETTFEWERGDTFCAPLWHAVSHTATTDSVLFHLSDEPVMRFSAYYRRELL